MLLVSTTIQPSLGIAFGVTALLAASAGREEFFQRESIFARMPKWAPWLFLALLAIASTVFGVLNPDVFAAIAA